MIRKYDIDQKAEMDTRTTRLLSDIEELKYRYQTWKRTYSTGLNASESMSITNFYGNAIEFLEKSKPSMDLVYEQAHDANSTLNSIINESVLSIRNLTSKLDSHVDFISNQGIDFNMPYAEFKIQLAIQEGTLINDEIVTRMDNLEVLAMLYDGFIYYGGNQDWFSSDIRINGGCGPTAAANIVAYLALTNPEYSDMFEGYYMTQESYASFMEMIYDQYVTPIEIYEPGGLLDAVVDGLVSEIIPGLSFTTGLDSFPGNLYEDPITFGVPPTAFGQGVVQLASDNGIDLDYEVIMEGDSSIAEVATIIENQIANNNPVALLNILDSVLMNYTSPSAAPDDPPKGRPMDLHWVTIVGIREDITTGAYELDVLTWGGTGTISLNELWDGRDVVEIDTIVGEVDIELPEAYIVYFERKD